MPERFRPFHPVRGWNLRTMTGYAGGSFAVQGTRLFVSGGADYRPLGSTHSRRDCLHLAVTERRAASRPQPGKPLESLARPSSSESVRR